MHRFFTDEDMLTATDNDGDTSELPAVEVVVPDGFPSDFPLYPKGTIDSAFEGSEGNFAVSAKTADAPKDVYEWYLAELEKNGWVVDQKLERASVHGAYANISCNKGDLKGRVGSTNDGGPTGTLIMITVSPV